MTKLIRIGTRASNLAMYQANLVKAACEKHFGAAEIVKITTKGDHDQRDFQKILGDGFFTRTIERALLLGQIDIAVHSAKDLPSLQHDNLPWVAFDQRAACQDVLIARKQQKIQRIGTSSPRRKAQMQSQYPDAEILPLRGNVETRLNKLRNGKYDAILLAKAGLERLGLLKDIEHDFALRDLDIITAPTQGILAIQCRKADFAWMQKIANEALSQTAYVEKEVLKFLGGGCHLPIGANAETGDYDFFRGGKRYTFQNEKEQYSQRVASSTSENSFTEKIILTHSIQQHEKVARLLAEAELGFYSYPLIETKTIFAEEQWQVELLDYDLIFTSPNAVRIFFQEAFARDLDVKKWQAKKIFCVGKATAKTLADFGFSSQDLPPTATSSELLKVIDSQNAIYCGNPDGEFAKNFQGKCFPLYKSFPYKELWAKPPESCRHMVFCSPSSVEFALQSLGKDQLKTRQLYSFGPVTSQALQKQGFSYIENPESGSWKKMIACIKEQI